MGLFYGRWEIVKSRMALFNITLTKAKQDFLAFKLKHGVGGGTLQPTDLVPLINRAWKSSFKCICANKKQ